jgi:hypothetical protein
MALPQRERLREAELVFRAEVEEIRASTMPELPATDATIVVVVEEVYRSPQILNSLAGKSITVITDEISSLRPKHEVLFLANAWLYGESIAVVEVGREMGDIDPAALRKYINAETEVARDEVLSDRIASADVVVTGTVTETRTVKPIDPATVSEHTPFWGEATIQVTTVEKGSLSTSDVVVVFPQSRDIKWHQAPKFHVGQQGIWILRKQRIEGMDREGFTALDALDFHTMHALERVRKLIRERH